VPSNAAVELNGGARRATICSVTSLRSPCTKNCRLDPATGLCRGCLRTIDEIARWGGASAAEQQRILAAIEERRARLKPEDRAP